MTILRFQIKGEAEGADGKTVEIKPGQVIRVHGPMAQVSVSLAESLVQPLIQQGQSVPAPIKGNALIDTGSSTSFIDMSAVQKLKVPVIDRIAVYTGTEHRPMYNVYPIRFDLPGLQAGININRTIGVPLKSQRLIAVLGRDFLQHFVLNYDGQTGTVTLTI